MQFRERRRVIQVIRTTYDPELKRGRAEVLGRIDKSSLTPSDKLLKICSAEELAEVRAFISERTANLHDEAVKAGAETLPAQMRRAAEYFRGHDDDEAKQFAAAIRLAWDELKVAIRKAGFNKERLDASAEPPKARRQRVKRQTNVPASGDGASPTAAPTTDRPGPDDGSASAAAG